MSFADYAFAVWETFYVTVLSTGFALALGLPLGVLLVAGDKDGVLPLPSWLMHGLNVVINILRSVPFLILMICVFPLSRAIIGTSVGTQATIVPLVVAGVPLCGPPGRDQPAGAGPRCGGGCPEHGRYPDADHPQGDDPGVSAGTDLQHDHGPDHYFGLFGHVRRDRRRWSGQGGDLVWILPLSDRYHADLCGAAGAAGAAVPVGGHTVGQQER